MMAHSLIQAWVLGSKYENWINTPFWFLQVGLLKSLKGFQVQWLTEIFGFWLFLNYPHYPWCPQQEPFLEVDFSWHKRPTMIEGETIFLKNKHWSTRTLTSTKIESN